MIDHRMIPKPLFVRQVERLKPCVEQVDPGEHGEVTYFEGMTALALDHFAIEKTDYVVLEVGLGGRLDATNVVTPAVCAITALGFDHAHILGHTLEKIAGEKAGIVKAGAPVVSSPQAEEAMEVLRSVCRERGTRLVEVGRDVTWEVRSLGDDRQVFDLCVMGRTLRGLEIGMTGAHQLSNAAVAAGVLELLGEAGAVIPDASLREGLSRTRWPGRMQVVGRSPTVVLDGAHTIESARSLAQALREGYRYRRLILVFGIAADKDISGVWRVLEREADVAYLTRSTFPKAAEPRAVHRMIDDSEVALHVVENGVEAFERARAEAGPDDLICVTGSFYLIGDIMRHLGIAAQEEA
jgi:dihydrofolate synthase/folylpolyglutamate synthase